MKYLFTHLLKHGQYLYAKNDRTLKKCKRIWLNREIYHVDGLQDNSVKISVPVNLMFEVNITPIQILAICFIDIKVILKYIWQGEENGICKTI